MKKYRVYMHIDSYIATDVEADSKEEAEEKGQELFAVDDLTTNGKKIDSNEMIIANADPGEVWVEEMEGE